ncbi:unnamed protein product [Toxocara canis]|uniref:Ubiquitin-like domain-containing protein n=1 Tax=Toxocara canis TaxID=6265 RepID=A0A183UCG1_TOXCA|nr:unnamed protein product [Toxocara canis]
MRLSVKASDGRVEMFDNVAMMSFQDLRVVVIDRFSLENDFSLMCGSQELPRDKNTKVVALEFGLVSGDRLRLVVTDKPYAKFSDDFLKPWFVL